MNMNAYECRLKKLKHTEQLWRILNDYIFMDVDERSYLWLSVIVQAKVIVNFSINSNTYIAIITLFVATKMIKKQKID